MLLTILLTFGLLLLLSFPIAALLAMVTAATLHLHTFTSLMVLPQQLFNALDNFILLSVPFFILAGGIMTEGALAQRLIDVINALVGGFRGGLALVSIFSCMFFAALSGSSPATVVAIGSIMIPALVKSGYNKDFSVGLLTSAGSLGIVIPPSIPMILYAFVMNVSVAKLFMAGIGPGILIGLAFSGYTYLLARKNNWRAQKTSSLLELYTALRKGFWGVLLPFIVLGGIYTGVFTPTEAAAISVVYALFVETVIYKELTLSGLTRVLKESAVLSACLLFILACAMTFVWLLTSQEIPTLLAQWIMERVHSRWLFLLLVNLLFLLMGSVMDDVSAMLILSPLFLETLNRFGIDLVHYGIIMVLVIEFGFLTPPFGLNLFVAMGLTRWSLMRTARSVVPFLIILLVCLFAITYLPPISLLLPRIFYPTP